MAQDCGLGVLISLIFKGSQVKVQALQEKIRRRLLPSMDVRVFVWRGKRQNLPWDYKNNKMSFLKQKTGSYNEAVENQHVLFIICLGHLSQYPKSSVPNRV